MMEVVDSMNVPSTLRRGGEGTSMRVKGRARSSTPRAVVDAALTAVVSVPGAVYALLGAEWPALTLPALALAGIALVWRRRAPMAVLVALAVLTSVAEPVFFTLLVCLAVFEVASTRSFSRAAIGYGVALVLPLLGTTAKIALGVHPGAPPGAVPDVGIGTSIVDPYVVVALAAGVVVQSTRHRKCAQEEILEQRIEHARALERARITAEMHDVVGHALTVMVSLANGARMAADTNPRGSKEALTQLGAVGARAVEEMQRTLRILRDADGVLDESLHSSGYDLPQLEDTAEVFRAAGLPVSLARTGRALPEHPLLLTAVHRIVQEGLTNALRYAESATRVEVAISYDGNLVMIDIVDDGRSVTPRASVGTERGLVGIAERAAAFGGSSAAGPRTPYGWEIRAVLRPEGQQ